MSFLKELALSQVEGKAIPNHPAFRDNVPLTTYVPGNKPQRKAGELSQREAARHMQAYGGIDAIDWVMDCIDLYADTTSSANWHFSKDGDRYYLPDDQDKPKGGKVVEQQLADLFTMPNPYMDYIELMQLLVIDLLLVGNAYWFKYRANEEGKPLALYRLSPLDVTVVPGPYGITSYNYKPKGQTSKLVISPEEIVHFKRPNPHSPYYGLGVIKGGGRPLDLELSLTDAQAHYFENRADPSLIVQSERRVPRDVFKKLTQQIRARASGTRNAGELLVLESGLKASTLDRNARETMFKELSEASRDRILSMFRISPKLLGINEQGSGQDKVQDSRREFDNKAMRPFLDKLQSRITWQLVAAYGYKFSIDYKYIMPPEELVKLASDLGSVPGIKVKEVREFLAEGAIIKEVGTGDDEIDELVLNLPGEEAEEDGFEGQGFADRSLPREAGRPPLGENTLAIPGTGKQLPAGARARRPQKKALPDKAGETMDQMIARLSDIQRLNPEAKALPSVEREGRTTVGNKLPDEQRPKDRLQVARERQIDGVISDTKVGIIDAMTTLERGLLDHVEGKAFNSKTTASRIKKSEAWQTFASTMTGLLEAASRQAASVAGVQQLEDGYDGANEVDYDAIAKRVVYRPEGVSAITGNLKSEIVQKVAKAVAEGGERADVDQVVRESVDFWRQGHAETVAMTEAVHAYNESTLSVYELSGVKEVVVYDGDEHDEPCKEANGQVWTINHARDNRLEHPRCRRAFGALGSDAAVS